MIADAKNYGKLSFLCFLSLLEPPTGLNTDFHPNVGTQWGGGMQYNSQSTITTDDLLTGMSASTLSGR